MSVQDLNVLYRFRSTPGLHDVQKRTQRRPRPNRWNLSSRSRPIQTALEDKIVELGALHSTLG